jgi:hypothetical protein
LLQKAPGLKRYEALKLQYRNDMLRVTELTQIYQATCDDLERLRFSERNMLDESEIDSNDSVVFG